MSIEGEIQYKKLYYLKVSSKSKSAHYCKTLLFFLFALFEFIKNYLTIIDKINYAIILIT